MNRSILLETRVSIETPAAKRVEEERRLAFPVQTFDHDEFTLAVNDNTGLSPGAIRTLSPIGAFLHLYAPYPVELTINSGLILPTFRGVFATSAALGTVRVRNLSLTQPVLCTALFA